MLNKLREFFLGLGSEAFEQSQNEAIVTMLVWVMQADGKLEPGEGTKIKDFVSAVNWTSEVPAKEFVQQARARVAQIAAGSLTEEELLKECSSKLKGAEIRYKAIQVCHELARADNYFDAAERHLLKLFSKALT